MEKRNEAPLSQWVMDRLNVLTAPQGWEPDAAAGLQQFRSARATRMHQRRMLTWAAVGGIVVCGGALAFPGTRVLASRCINACLAQTSIPGPSSGNKAQPIQGRTPAPLFTLPDAFGKPLRLSDLQGRVVLLNFWATWCEPCKVEMPWFIELQRQYEASGVTVVGVAMDDNGRQSVSAFVGTMGINYRTVVGSDELARQYGGVDALPTTFLIDRHGRIADVCQGLQPKSTYESKLRSLIAEKD
jgi:cytochrome c biogenesis protein CcmG/thiol:disulfide interchange protein DsbE